MCASGKGHKKILTFSVCVFELALSLSPSLLCLSTPGILQWPCGSLIKHAPINIAMAHLDVCREV